MKRLFRILGIVGHLMIFCAVSVVAQAAAAQVLPPQPPPAQQTPPVSRPTAPARDAASAPLPTVGTAVVHGRVTSAADRQPLQRVRITMNGPAANPPTAVTDANGTFEITEIPAGSYSISASRAGFLTVQYGQQRPRESGQRLQVKNGDVIERIDIVLFSGAVLAGRILNELAEPMPGVRVEAMELAYTRGHRLPLPAGFTITNDLGEFRLADLNPGRYYVRASTTERWPDEDERKGSYAYGQTFYPGALGSDRAETINLATGQHVESLDFPLVVGRAVHVSGTLISATGEPMPNQRVGLSRIDRTTGGALYSSSSIGAAAQTDSSGAFEIADIPPGEYLVGWGSQQTESVNIPLMVTDGDITGLVLSPRRSSSLRGSITTDEGGAPPFAPARVRIAPLSTDPASVLPAWSAASPQAPGGDWSFRFANIDGLYIFRLTDLPDEWMLKSVLLSGRDITDTPLDIPAGGSETSGVQVVLTRHAAKVSGDIHGPDGKALAEGTVVVFSADDRRWGLGSRFVKTTRPDNAGHYAVGGLPPGPYLAIVKESVIDGQCEDADYLRSLVPDALKVELSEDAEQKITLVLTPEPQR